MTTPASSPPLTMRQARALVSRAARKRHAERHEWRSEAHEPGPWHDCGAGPCEEAQRYVWGGLDGRYVVPSGCAEHPQLDSDEDDATHDAQRECSGDRGCTCGACMRSHVEHGMRLALHLSASPRGDPDDARAH